MTRCHKSKSRYTSLDKMDAFADSAGLKDSLQALLSQLELSWMDADRKITTDILDAVLIFVKSFGGGGGREADDAAAADRRPSKQDWRVENLERGALTRVVLALKRSDEVLDEADDLEREPCPEGGFHEERSGLRDAIADGESGMEGGEGGVDEDARPVATERTAILRDVLDRARHFISMVKRPEWQIVALDIVARCVALLEMEQ